MTDLPPTLAETLRESDEELDVDREEIEDLCVELLYLEEQGELRDVAPTVDILLAMAPEPDDE